MRILVTGASGFIGSHIARRLDALGNDVVAAGRDRRRLSRLDDTSSRLVAGDLSCDDLTPLVQDCDAIVHCAARASPWGAKPLFHRDNVLSTQRLLAAADVAKTVRRFVFISSPSIYFRQRDQLNHSESVELPERWPTHYAHSKWLAECAVRAAPRLGPVILRPRAVFGPHDTAILPRLIAAAQMGFFPLPGRGRAWTDVTYVDNVVDAVQLALAAPRQIEGRAFNITNGEPVQVRDLITRLFAALQIKTRLVGLPRCWVLGLAKLSECIAVRRSGQPEPRLTQYGVGLLGYSQTLCIAAARENLGYLPKVSNDDGLERLARWWVKR